MREIKFRTPFYACLNVNIKNARSKGGGSHTTTEAKAAITHIQWLCKIACREAGVLYKWKERKYYVAIMVYMPPGYKGDAGNFEKPLVDAIEPILRVDDEHCAPSTDFERNSDDPRFEITVTQEDE